MEINIDNSYIENLKMTNEEIGEIVSSLKSKKDNIKSNEMYEFKTDNFKFNCELKYDDDEKIEITSITNIIRK